MFKYYRNRKKFMKSCKSNRKGSYEKAVKYYNKIAGKGNIIYISRHAKMMEAKRLWFENGGK